MRKLLITLIAAWMAAGLVMGGGLITNTNQSAAWVRMPVRDASKSIDAVFYNPAGLFNLNDGFHFSINNQYITQKLEVENFYKGPGNAYGLNVPLYKGTVLAPLFPGVYGVWKKNNLAVSFGVNPIGGGGGAEYKKGLPSFEMSPSDMVPTLAAYGATAYQLDVYFKGTSIYMGYQLGVSYKISDLVQVFGGARYVTVKNTYKGHLKDVKVNMSGTWTPVPDVFTGLAAQATAGAAGANTLATQMGGLATALGASATLADAEAFSAINAAQRAAIEAGLTQMGIPITLGVGTLQTACTSAAAQYTAAATQATATATLTGTLFNQEADVVQTGSGVTPIVGANFNFGDRFNVGIKYEFATRIDIKNKTTKDIISSFDPKTGLPITMFPDGQKIRSDLPWMLSVGANLGLTDRLTLAVGGHFYGDRSANYGKKLNNEFVPNDTVIDKNYIELAAGLEYKLTDKFLVSFGYLYTKTGVNKDYQSDMNFDLNTKTLGLGGQYSITDKLKVNLGVCNAWYVKDDKIVSHDFAAGGITFNPRETYWKNTLIIAAGVDISF